jgi:hypothetical protein
VTYKGSDHGRCFSIISRPKVTNTTIPRLLATTSSSTSHHPLSSYPFYPLSPIMPLNLDINIIPRNKTPVSTRKPHAHHHKCGALQRHLSRRVDNDHSTGFLPSRIRRSRRPIVQLHGALQDAPPPPYSILAPADRLTVAHPSPPSLHRPHADHIRAWDRLYSAWELTHVPRTPLSAAAHPAQHSMSQAACVLLLVFFFGILIC